LRWFHFLAGITDRLLYYFNFVQTPFFATPTPRCGPA